MKINWKNNPKQRAMLLAGISIVFLAWNLLLSTQRKNLGGRFQSIQEEEVLLKVACAGKIEPKIQQTVRSVIEGRKLAEYMQEGKAVKKGTLLLEISDENIRVELTQKRNAANNAYADMIKAKKDYSLERALFKQQAVPQREVENAKETYERAKQAYQAESDSLGLVEIKALGTKVAAPMDGVIIKDFVRQEEWITNGKELFTVAKLEHFVMRGTVDELDISKVKEGQDAQIKCDAFPNQTILGHISWIGAQAGEGAFAGIEVQIDITDNKGIELKPNLSAEASIVSGTIPKGIVVPVRAIRTNAKETYVLVKKWGGWLVRRHVNVAHVNFGDAVISQGLESGESILIPREE